MGTAGAVPLNCKSIVMLSPIPVPQVHSMTERGDVPLLHPERPALNTQSGSKAQTQTSALSPTRLGPDLEEKIKDGQ